MPEAVLAAGRLRGGHRQHRRVTRRRVALVSGVVCVLGVLGLALSGTQGVSQAGTLGSWSGDVASGGSYFSVTADFTVPTPDCTQASPALSSPGRGETAYWVGLQKGPDIVRSGFMVQCSGASPVYTALSTTGLAGTWHYLPDPFEAGDFIELGVSCSASTCYEAAVDAAQGNWVSYVPVAVPDGFTGRIAAVAAESYYGGAPSTLVAVTSAQVNIQPIGQSNPQPNIADPSNYNALAYLLIPGPLNASGQDFDLSWIT
jgi:Peptidase A4 family